MRFDLADEVGSGLGVAETERDVGAGMGERECDGAAEAATGAGDERHLAVQVETREVGHA